jgi:hypothetical protein
MGQGKAGSLSHTMAAILLAPHGLVKPTRRAADPRDRADPAAEEIFQPPKMPDFLQKARRGSGQAALEAL